MKHYTIYSIFALLLLIIVSCSNESGLSNEELITLQLLQEDIVDREEEQRSILKENTELSEELKALEEKLNSIEVDAWPRTEELPNPVDRIRDSQIRIGYYGVDIRLRGMKSHYLVDSNSMDPILDEGVTVLSIKPSSEKDIKIGDILVYQMGKSEIAVVHRVIAIDSDEDGVFYTTKGDNNAQADPFKVRFRDITSTVVGILY